MRFRNIIIACLIVLSINACANPQSSQKGIWDESVYMASPIKLADETKAIWIVTDLKDSKLNFTADNAQELLTHYLGQPESKQKKGIFIYSKSFAIPDTPEERRWMSMYLQQLYDDPVWRKSESDLVDKLMKACVSEQVPLYVNMSINLQGNWKVLNEPKKVAK